MTKCRRVDLRSSLCELSDLVFSIVRSSFDKTAIVLVRLRSNTYLADQVQSIRAYKCC